MPNPDPVRIAIESQLNPAGFDQLEARTQKSAGDIKTLLASAGGEIEKLLATMEQQQGPEFVAAMVEGMNAELDAAQAKLDGPEIRAARERAIANERELHAITRQALADEQAAKRAAAAEDMAARQRAMAAQQEASVLARTALAEEQQRKRAIAAEELATKQRLAANERELHEITRRALAEEREERKRIKTEQDAANRSELGGGGIMGKIGKGLGIGNIAATAGFAGIIGNQIVNEASQYAEELAKALTSGSGLTRELYEQVKQWQELAKAAQSQQDVDRLTKQTSNTIEGTRDKIIQVKDGWDDTAKSLILSQAALYRWVPGLSTIAQLTGDVASQWQTISELQQESIINQVGQQEILAAKNVEIAQAEARNAEVIKQANEDRKERVAILKEEAEGEREAAREAEQAAKAGEQFNEHMAKLGEKFKEMAQRDGEALNEQMGKLAEKFREGQKENVALLDSLRGEQKEMQAQLASQDLLAQKLKIQQAAHEQIEKLRNSGRLTAEVQQEIEKTSQLKQQVAELQKQEQIARAKAQIDETINSIDPDVDKGSKVTVRNQKIARSREKTMAQLDRELADAKTKGLITDDEAKAARERATQTFDQKVKQELGRFGGTKPSTPGSNLGAIGGKQGFDEFGNPVPAATITAPTPAPAAPQGGSDLGAGLLPVAGAAQDLTSAAAQMAPLANGVAQLTDGVLQLAAQVGTVVNGYAAITKMVAEMQSKLDSTEDSFSR